VNTYLGRVVIFSGWPADLHGLALMGHLLLGTTDLHHTLALQSSHSIWYEYPEYWPIYLAFEVPNKIPNISTNTRAIPPI